MDLRELVVGRVERLLLGSTSLDAVSSLLVVDETQLVIETLGDDLLEIWSLGERGFTDKRMLVCGLVFETQFVGFACVSADDHRVSVLDLIGLVR